MRGTRRQPHESLQGVTDPLELARRLERNFTALDDRDASVTYTFTSPGSITHQGDSAKFSGGLWLCVVAYAGHMIGAGIGAIGHSSAGNNFYYPGWMASASLWNHTTITFDTVNSGTTTGALRVITAAGSTVNRVTATFTSLI